MYNFCAKYFQIETFWSRDVIDIWVLAHFQFKIHKDFMY